MKRKLVLTFDGNKLLHATVTERGRRTRLAPVVTAQDALKEVTSIVASALATMEESRKPTSSEVVLNIPVVPVVPAVLTSSTSPVGFVGTTISDVSLVKDQTASITGTAIVEPNGLPIATAGPIIVPTEPTTISVLMDSNAPRPRSVCARPKPSEEVKATFSSSSFAIEG